MSADGEELVMHQPADDIRGDEKVELHAISSATEEDPADKSMDENPVAEPKKKKKVNYGKYICKGVKHSFRSNVKTGFVLFCFGLSLLLLYSLVDDVTEDMDDFAAERDSWGIVFSFIGTAFFGGTVPVVIVFGIKRYQLRQKRKKAMGLVLNGIVVPVVQNGKTGTAIIVLEKQNADKVEEDEEEEDLMGLPKLEHRVLTLEQAFKYDIIYLTIFWFLKGIDVDRFYALQNYVFGTDTDFATIATKVAVDQFVYNPLWGVKTVGIPYLLREVQYDWKAFKQKLYGTHRTLFWFHDIPQLLFTTWMIWGPTVCLVYQLPLTLQIPFFNIVLMFSSCVMQTMFSDDKHGNSEEKKMKEEEKQRKREEAAAAAAEAVV